MMERANAGLKTTAKNNSTPYQTKKHVSSLSLNSPIEHIQRLQQNLGNQAVQSLYKSGKLQAALKIGQPNDAYELEADRMADHIMRMPDSAVQLKPG